MGLLTLEEITAEVKAGLGNRADLDSRLTTLINLGQKRVARAHNFSEMQQLKTDAATELGVKTYDVKTLLGASTYEEIRDIHTIRLISGTMSRKLIRLPPETMDELLPYPEEFTDRKPASYVWYGNNLEFLYIPNAIYTVYVRWSKWPADLTAGEKSELRNKDDVIIAFTLSNGFSSLKVIDAAKHWYLIAKDLLARSIQDDLVKADQEIKPRTEYKTQVGEYWANPWVKTGP